MKNQNITVSSMSSFASALSFVVHHYKSECSVLWKDWIAVLKVKTTVMVHNLN